ncbi:Vacuole morphology and inheritance protein 14 like protein [Aduncisulcus paluster]|uniref:Vacuole morphology and inheritance protein 14 like protein n=1 Tax=Aduncisulcus paluster TaxID=2918883 RepID=A0ABQ5KPC9_9EUKA|nr:Vacuole morphology and inheritance protein 14 like protein [Aduncisulcus paluster]
MSSILTGDIQRQIKSLNDGKTESAVREMQKRIGKYLKEENIQHINELNQIITTFCKDKDYLTRICGIRAYCALVVAASRPQYFALLDKYMFDVLSCVSSMARDKNKHVRIAAAELLLNILTNARPLVMNNIIMIFDGVNVISEERATNPLLITKIFHEILLAHSDPRTFPLDAIIRIIQEGSAASSNVIRLNALQVVSALFSHSFVNLRSSVLIELVPCLLRLVDDDNEEVVKNSRHHLDVLRGNIPLLSSLLRKEMLVILLSVCGNNERKQGIMDSDHTGIKSRRIYEVVEFTKSMKREKEMERVADEVLEECFLWIAEIVKTESNLVKLLVEKRHRERQARRLKREKMRKIKQRRLAKTHHMATDSTIQSHKSTSRKLDDIHSISHLLADNSKEEGDDDGRTLIDGSHIHTLAHFPQLLGLVINSDREDMPKGVARLLAALHYDLYILMTLSAQGKIFTDDDAKDNKKKSSSEGMCGSSSFALQVIDVCLECKQLNLAFTWLIAVIRTFTKDFQQLFLSSTPNLSRSGHKLASEGRKDHEEYADIDESEHEAEHETPSSEKKLLHDPMTPVEKEKDSAIIDGKATVSPCISNGVSDASQLSIHDQDIIDVHGEESSRLSLLVQAISEGILSGNNEVCAGSGAVMKLLCQCRWWDLVRAIVHSVLTHGVVICIGEAQRERMREGEHKAKKYGAGNHISPRDDESPSLFDAIEEGILVMLRRMCESASSIVVMGIVAHEMKDIVENTLREIRIDSEILQEDGLVLREDVFDYLDEITRVHPMFEGIHKHSTLSSSSGVEHDHGLLRSQHNLPSLSSGSPIIHDRLKAITSFSNGIGLFFISSPETIDARKYLVHREKEKMSQVSDSQLSQKRKESSGDHATHEEEISSSNNTHSNHHGRTLSSEEIGALEFPSCPLTFSVIFKSCSLSPAALLGISVYCEHYDMCASLSTWLATHEYSAREIVYLDRLAQLLETPIFTHVRLKLLDPLKYCDLYKCLYTLLVILPPVRGFKWLERRLRSVSTLIQTDIMKKEWKKSPCLSPEIQELFDFFVNNSLTIGACFSAMGLHHRFEMEESEGDSSDTSSVFVRCSRRLLSSLHALLPPSRSSKAVNTRLSSPSNRSKRIRYVLVCVIDVSSMLDRRSKRYEVPLVGICGRVLFGIGRVSLRPPVHIL